MSPGTACVIRAALVLHKKCVREGYELGDAAHNPQDVLEEDPARNHAPKELTGQTAHLYIGTDMVKISLLTSKCNSWACWCKS